MGVDLEQWFASEVTCRCATHPEREATATCGRCGTFCCAGCRDAGAAHLCVACGAAIARERLPTLARSIAWKLLLVPVIALGSVVALGARHGVPGLQEVATVGLLGWLVPLLCGLRLVLGPSVIAAWVGSLGSLALVGLGLLDATWADAAQARYLDLFFLGVGPLVGLAGAWELTRALRSLRFQDALAGAPLIAR